MTERSRMLRGLTLVAAVALLAGCSSSTGSPSGTAASAACSSPATAGAAYAMATCEIPAPSLAGNLLGDPAVLSAYILTPTDYETSGRSYPVVYLLAGYTDLGAGLAYATAASAAAPAAKVNPIVAVVSGVNALGGGFYVNSTVSGNWEDAITKDLVGYVDSHYRTLAAAASRGISGHSMGGAGAVNMAMRHPELFGALYAMSPGLFDAAGAQARLGDVDVVDRVLDIEADVAGLSPAESASRIVSAAGSGAVQFEYAYGVAFAPDPASPSLMRFPFSRIDGQVSRDDAVWAAWEAGFGNLPAKVEQYKASLLGLRGIVIDYGSRDEYTWIPQGSHYFVGLLQAAGISAQEVIFDGAHNDQVNDRVANHMLPFMIDKLAEQ